MNATVKAQQVINRLAERSIIASRQPIKCKLGSESLPRRGNACSACPVGREFELDQAVAELINAGAFKGTGACPYQVMISHAVAALTFSPEVIRAKSAGRYRVDPVVEIKGALKRIRAITRATRWSREDIEGLSNKDAYWEAVEAVFAAEHALQKALPIFQSQTTRLPRGRRSAARPSRGPRHGDCLARPDRPFAGAEQWQLPQTARRRGRHHRWKCRQRAESGICDQDSGGAYQERASDHELIARKRFALAPADAIAL